MCFRSEKSQSIFLATIKNGKTKILPTEVLWRRWLRQKKERERASREVFLVQRNQLLAYVCTVIGFASCLTRFFSGPVVDVITMKQGFHKALASVKINVPCNDQLLDHFPEFRVGVLSGFLGGRHKLLKKLQEVLDCWNL